MASDLPAPIPALVFAEMHDALQAARDWLQPSDERVERHAAFAMVCHALELAEAAEVQPDLVCDAAGVAMNLD